METSTGIWTLHHRTERVTLWTAGAHSFRWAQVHHAVVSATRDYSFLRCELALVIQVLVLSFRKWENSTVSLISNAFFPSALDGLSCHRGVKMDGYIYIYFYLHTWGHTCVYKYAYRSMNIHVFKVLSAIERPWSNLLTLFFLSVHLRSREAETVVSLKRNLQLYCSLNASV